MKKTRVLSLGLALALTLTLTVPAAFAAEEDFITVEVEELQDGSYGAFLEEFYVQYAQEHPEEYAAFDPYAWFEEDWGDYWDSPEEFTGHMVGEGYWDSADDFAWEMWKGYLGLRADAAWNAKAVADYRAAHPGELEALTTEELLARKGYTETLTPLEQFMEDWGLDTAEAAEEQLVNSYVSARNWVEECAALAAEYRAADPESWESFDADGFFAEHWAMEGQSKEAYMEESFVFTEAELADWMYVQYMDGRDYYDGVDYDPGFTYGPGYEPWDWDSRPLRLFVNGTFAASEADGSIYAVDGVSYAAPGLINEVLDAHYPNSYGPVPIRAAAQLRGWDVVWNQHDNTVALIDPAPFHTGAFDAFDKLMARAMELSRAEAGRTVKTTETAALSLTVLNSIDGDKTCRAELTTTLIQRDGVFNMELKLSAAGLLELLSPQALSRLTAGETALSLKELRTLLKGLEVSVILDLNEGVAYCNAPFLTLLTGDEAAGGAWLAIDLGDGLEEALPLMEEMLSGAWNTEALLYAQLLAQSAEGYLGADYAYTSAVRAYDMMKAVAGPEAVTEQNGAVTWRMDAAALNAAMGGIAGEELPAEPFREYDVSMTITGDGRFTSSTAIRPDTDALGAMLSGNGRNGISAAGLAAYQWLMGALDFRMTSRSAGTGQQSEGSLRFQWKNQLELTMEVSSTRKEVKDTLLRLAPPEGAAVIPLSL